VGFALGSQTLLYLYLRQLEQSSEELLVLSSSTSIRSGEIFFPKGTLQPFCGSWQKPIYLLSNSTASAKLSSLSEGARFGRA